MNEIEIRRMGKECMALIRRKMSHEIGPEEYYSEMMLLERKYPGVGFKRAAETYIRHRTRAEVKEFKQKAYEPEDEEPPF